MTDSVLRLFLTFPRASLQYVMVVFPDHTLHFFHVKIRHIAHLENYVCCMLIICMLGNFSRFCCRLLTVPKSTFSINPDHERRSVGPNLGPNGLERL